MSCLCFYCYCLSGHCRFPRPKFNCIKIEFCFTCTAALGAAFSCSGPLFYVSCNICLINDDNILLLLYSSYISHDLSRTYFCRLQPPVVSPDTNKIRLIKSSISALGGFFLQREKVGNTELLILINAFRAAINNYSSAQYIHVRSFVNRGCSARYKYDCRLFTYGRCFKSFTFSVQMTKTQLS